MNDDYLSKAKQEIALWEQQGPSWLAQVGDFILWPATKLAEMLIPNGVYDAVGKAVEAFLLGISNVSDRTVNHDDIRERVAAARATFGEPQEMSHDLAAADQSAQHYWNWNLGYAGIEGGGFGALGLLGLAADIPALFTVSSPWRSERSVREQHRTGDGVKPARHIAIAG